MAANTAKQYERAYAELAEPGLTKFEIAKAIAMRAYAISYGSRPLVSSLGELVAKPELRQKFGTVGRERFTDQFRHETMTRRIREVYAEVLQAGK